MLDTLKLSSPTLDELTAQSIEQSLKKRICYQPGTGELLYDITSDSLAGSYDSKVHVRLWRERFEAVAAGTAISAPLHRTGRKTVNVELVPCDPYLVIEGSVHKAIMGHNITGGPVNFQPAARWFVDDLSRRLGVDLPHGLTWTVERVDWAEVYLLEDGAIREFISALAMGRYGRRQVSSYGDGESIFAPGTTTAFKVYHKGAEFTKHDKKRLQLYYEPDYVKQLQALANGTMRVETSIKSKKLQSDFFHKPQVSEITDEYLKLVHDREVGRLQREGAYDVKIVRHTREVEKRLNSLYSPSVADSLYGLWSKLAMQGESHVKPTMSRTRYYARLKQLRDAGISWTATNIVERESLIPTGFSLTRNDPRRQVEESPAVICALAPYRVAI